MRHKRLIGIVYFQRLILPLTSGSFHYPGLPCKPLRLLQLTYV